MIQLHFDVNLPMLGVIGQEGEDTIVCLNNLLLPCFSHQERAELFNRLVRAMELRGRVVDIDDRRKLREIGRVLTAVHIQKEEVERVLATNTTKR